MENVETASSGSFERRTQIMIKHIFKLTWNKKGQHIFLIAELFFFFLAVSFIAFVMVSVSATKKSTETFSRKNLLSIQLQFNDNSNKSQIKKQLVSQIKGVKLVSLTNGTPDFRSWNVVRVTYRNKHIGATVINTDEDFAKVMELKLREGRWFNPQESANTRIPIVINQNLSRALFNDKNAINRVIDLESANEKYLVVGVFENLSSENNRDDGECIFYRYQPDAGHLYLMVKLDTALNDNIYSALEKLQLVNDPSMRIGEIDYLEQKKVTEEKSEASFFIVISLVCCFPLLNIVLGLYSILYQTINRRKEEIGIRRAAGATSGNIYWQIVLEVIALATLALLLGWIAGYQFMLFNVLKGKPGDYMIAMTIASIFIYVLTSLCALYPAYLAARIHPAEALHDD